MTDHDTASGNAEAMARGREVGLEVAPGVEISAEHAGHTVHILGYYPDAKSARLEALLSTLRRFRDERNPQILERMAELGRPVPYAEVAAQAGNEVVGRPHIAAVIVRKGYAKSVVDAFRRYLARGASAYVKREAVPAADAIPALLAAHAVPVLAHPGLLKLATPEEADALVGELVALGLRGLEAHYSAHSPNQAGACARLAARHGLVVTGGSDFHGATGAGVRMGVGRGNLRVPYRLLARLKDAHAALCS